MYYWSYIVIEGNQVIEYINIWADTREAAEEAVEEQLLRNYPEEMEQMLLEWRIEN